MELNFCDRGIPLCTEVLVLAASKLSKYVTALSAYNVKSFTYEINQHTQEHTNTHTRARARSHTHVHTGT